MSVKDRKGNVAMDGSINAVFSEVADQYNKNIAVVENYDKGVHKIFTEKERLLNMVFTFSRVSFEEIEIESVVLFQYIAKKGIKIIINKELLGILEKCKGMTPLEHILEYENGDCLQFLFVIFDEKKMEYANNFQLIEVFSLLTFYGILKYNCNYIRYTSEKNHEKKVLVNNEIITKNAKEIKLGTEIFFERNLDDKHVDLSTLDYKCKASYQYITYGELNANAEQLSKQIVDAVVTQNPVIAICIKGRIALVTAILACIKANKTYTCIYPELPHERKMQIITENAACLLLKDNFTGSKEEIEIEFINLLETNRITSDKLLYSIFTSGTVSKPNNVGVTQGGLINYIDWRITNYELNHWDRSLLILYENFDTFYSGLFSALLSGGTLVMCSLENRRNYQVINTMIQNCKVSNLNATPRMFHTMLKIATKGELQSLRFVVLGGENIAKDLFQLLEEKEYSSIQIINEYGLTETTIACCAELDITSDNLNCIGKPISNCNIRIIDEFNNILSTNQIGEIAVSGACLSKGYLNNHKSNQEKFIILEDILFFKTGDFGYMDPYGKVYFVGRKEENRKINGIRFSLTEIEYIIQTIRGVSDVAATVFRKNNLEKIIIFVTGTEEVIAEEIEERVKQKLYLQSIPLLIIKTDSIPVNDSGKKDTDSLLEKYVNQVLNNIGGGSNEQGDDLEREIEQLWCRLLEVNQVANDKPFFEVGGNSLLLMEMFKTLEEKYGSRVKLVDLFNYPTIKLFSDYLRKLIVE